MNISSFFSLPSFSKTAITALNQPSLLFQLLRYITNAKSRKTTNLHCKWQWITSSIDLINHQGNPISLKCEKPSDNENWYSWTIECLTTSYLTTTGIRASVNTFEYVLNVIWFACIRKEICTTMDWRNQCPMAPSGPEANSRWKSHSEVNLCLDWDCIVFKLYHWPGIEDSRG